MNELIPFDFNGNSVRVILDANNELLFVAKDVAEALEYTWAGSATTKHVPDEWKGVNSVLTPFGVQEMNVLKEPGLYFFLGRSDKPKALPLQKWVAGEVLPSIRKTGSYSINKQPDMRIALSDPVALRSMLLSFTEEVISLKSTIQEQAPKVEFYDAVTEAVNCQTVQQSAKALNIGPNKLFEFLRKERILMNNNLPYQQFINDKHFRVVNKPYTDRRGEQRISTRTLVTGKGLVLIQKRLASAIGRARLREIAAML